MRGFTPLRHGAQTGRTAPPKVTQRIRFGANHPAGAPQQVIISPAGHYRLVYRKTVDSADTSMGRQ